MRASVRSWRSGNRSGRGDNDEVIQEKTHLALDTDWMTAAFIAFCFVLCLLTIAATTRQVLVGGPVKAGVTWDTVFLFLAFGSLALRVRERIMKFGCVLLSIVFGSRFVLALVHTSLQIQLFNAQIIRVVELVVMIVLCYSSRVGSSNGSGEYSFARKAKHFLWNTKSLPKR
jgi:hypothetical protein